MKEQLQDKLGQILDGLMAATKATVDFAGAQLPDIAQSYIMYGTAKAVAGIFMCIITIGLFIFAVKKALAAPKDRYGGMTVEAGLAMVFGSFAAIISCLILISYTHELLLVTLAPKVWLLQEIASLIRSFK